MPGVYQKGRLILLFQKRWYDWLTTGLVWTGLVIRYTCSPNLLITIWFNRSMWPDLSYFPVNILSRSQSSPGKSRPGAVGIQALWQGTGLCSWSSPPDWCHHCTGHMLCILMELATSRQGSPLVIDLLSSSSAFLPNRCLPPALYRHNFWGGNHVTTVCRTT